MQRTELSFHIVQSANLLRKGTLEGRGLGIKLRESVSSHPI
jgi:hypothetical protein